ncbi:MAG: hypothetical protein EP340_04125 [Alphaproteobacteria bacterium]|nr:MAG: hypothetical protein EP340_04125 [Alphaproteobacteria bacterium]
MPYTNPYLPFWQAFKTGAWAAGTTIIVGHTKTRISHFPEWQQDLIEVALNTFGPTVLSKLVPPILGTLYEGSKAVGKSVKEMAGDVGEQASHFYDQISHPRSPKDK